MIFLMNESEVLRGLWSPSFPAILRALSKRKSELVQCLNVPRHPGDKDLALALHLLYLLQRLEGLLLLSCFEQLMGGLGNGLGETQRDFWGLHRSDQNNFISYKPGASTGYSRAKKYGK